MHEGGHYLTARCLGIRAGRITVGVGPVIARMRLAGDVELVIRLLPVLAYVTFDDPMRPSAYRSYREARQLARIAVHLGGAAGNYLLSTCLVFYLAAAGQLGQRAGHSAGVDWLDSVHMALVLPAECVCAQWAALVDLLHGQLGRIVGPAAISAALASAANSGRHAYASLIALLSIAVGFFNLLPLPGLDGGRILFEIWALLTRRPISANLEARVNGAFAMLLLALICTLTVVETNEYMVEISIASAVLIMPLGVGAAAGALLGARGYGIRLLGVSCCVAALGCLMSLGLAIEIAVLGIPLAILGYVLASPSDLPSNAQRVDGIENSR